MYTKETQYKDMEQLYRALFVLDLVISAVKSATGSQKKTPKLG